MSDDEDDDEWLPFDGDVDDYHDDECGLARRTDPETSHAAAESINPTPVEQEICADLRSRGTATTEALSARLGMSLVTVSPRMKPMEAKGLVCRCGLGVNRSGRKAILWNVVAEEVVVHEQ